jgi:RNA polymerase sigma-70 factor (ECF subfamily)
LAELYAAHFKGVRSSVRFFGVPERDADDVVQDAFVRVHASLPGYDPQRSVKPWLYTIAYRTAQDYLRSAHARRVRLAPSEEDMDPVDAAPSPEGRAELAEMQRIYVAVLQGIDEDQRIVYLMHVKDEIGIPEIAELLELPEGTVRSRLARARQAIAAEVARRQGVAQSTSPVLAPLLVPAALADAAREGFSVDPAVQAVVWSKLSRLLGLGILGALAPMSGAAIAASAALLLAVGGGAGALLHARLSPPAAAARVEQVAPTTAPSSLAGRPEATARASAAPTMTPTAIATTEPGTAGPDAGAPDAASLLRAEGAILGRAREAMDRAAWATALRELQRHARAFPHGKLAAQREELMRVVREELGARDGGSR